MLESSLALKKDKFKGKPDASWITRVATSGRKTGTTNPTMCES